MRYHVEVNPSTRVDLAAKIVERHEKCGGELVRLVLDLPVSGIPPNDILRIATNTVWMCGPVQ
jgi:hypothetical protein